MNKPMPTEIPTRPPAPAPSLGPEEPSFAAILERMSPEERLRAYRSGAFDRRERTIWAARHPEEVPLVNGEFEWIALTVADLD